MRIGPALRSLLLLAAVAVLAACATSSNPAAPGASSATTSSSASPPTTATRESPTTTGPTPPPDTERTPALPSPTVTTGTPTGGATSTVTGTLTSIDDVEGGGSAPGSGTVAIVPVEREGELWDAIEFTPDDQSLPTVGGLVDPDVVAGMAVVDAGDGSFEVEVAHGDHVVCLLGGTGPYLLLGCARATVDGPTSWEITRGEGGVSLSS